MPAASDLVAYMSANRPTDDASTSGGAISTTARPLDSQFAAAAVAALVSDNGADTTQTATIVGRNAAGEIVSENVGLNGTTEVLSSATFERIHSVTLDGVAAGTVLLKQGSGGTTRHTFAAGELVAAIFFQRAAADPSSGKVRYEKYFWKNEHGSESLTSATLELTTDAAGLYEVAVSDTIDDSESVANRLAAPSGETFVDDGVTQAVPGGGALAAGEAIGHWVKQSLSAGEAAAKETFTTTLAGTSV